MNKQQQQPPLQQAKSTRPVCVKMKSNSSNRRFKAYLVFIALTVGFEPALYGVSGTVISQLGLRPLLVECKF